MPTSTCGKKKVTAKEKESKTGGKPLTAVKQWHVISPEALDVFTVTVQMTVTHRYTVTDLPNGRSVTFQVIGIGISSAFTLCSADMNIHETPFSKLYSTIWSFAVTKAGHEIPVWTHQSDCGLCMKEKRLSLMPYCRAVAATGQSCVEASSCLHVFAIFIVFATVQKCVTTAAHSPFSLLA